MMLGMVHLKMENFASAKEAYEGALALDPENEDVQAYLETVDWHLAQDEARSGEADTEPARDQGGR